MKKMISIFMGMIMILAMGITVSAAENGSVTINDDDGNTFTAYKVAAVEEAGNDGNGNTLYTYNLNSEFSGFFANGVNGYSFNKTDGIVDSNAQKIATDGVTNNTNATDAAKLASALAKYARDNGIATKTEFVAGTKTSLEYGYYVIAETESAEGTAVASKPILVDVKGDVTINPKDDDITIDKVIVENGNGVEANNVNIGDVIPFKVTSSIPQYEANVDKSKLTYSLSDTFTNMDFDADSVELYANGTKLTQGTDFTLTPRTNDFVIDLTQDTIYNNQGADIILTYSATLNENAVVDSTVGNPNEIVLKYTNNPNQDDSFDTIKDETKTYTYGFKLHKVDKNNNTADMAGAQFTIKDSNGTLIGTFTYGANGEIVADNLVITTDGNYAILKGLDAGQYTIVETKAPNGYALLGGSVTVTITDKGEEETHTPNGIAQIAVSGQGSVESEVTENGDGTINLTVKVENVKGINLPETGSTTALYCLIGGALLLVLGGAWFALSKKMNRKA